MTTPVVEGGIIVVQAGSHLKYLGRLDLLVQGDSVAAHEGRLIELVAEGATAGEPLAGLVAGWRQRVESVYGEVIGRLVTPWRRHGGESNIGNWLTDRLRERAGADVGFLNSGTIRKDLPAGPVTLLDVHEILPFANRIVTFPLTGRELLGVLAHVARSAADGEHGTLQVSGLRYAWAPAAGGGVEVREVTVGGRPLEPDATYLVALPDYVALKADQYLGIAPPAYEEVGAGLTETIVAAVRAAGEIDARVEGRIRELP